MTVGGDFIPVDDLDADKPSYPVVFGVALTPQVGGIVLALLGVAGAGWLVLNLVLPAYQANQTLRQEIDTKRQQLVDQTEIQRQIEEARAELVQAEQLRADVLALFADEESLDTLLLDLNARVQGAEVVTPGPDDETGGAAVLERFALVTEGDAAESDSLVTDGSFGPDVNNRLRQRVYDVQINGTFGQTQSIIRNIERLKPLLVVQDLTVRTADAPVLRVNLQGQPQGTPPEPRLITSFRLIALVPLEELPQAAPPPADPNAPAAPADPNAPAQ